MIIKYTIIPIIVFICLFYQNLVGQTLQLDSIVYDILIPPNKAYQNYGVYSVPFNFAISKDGILTFWNEAGNTLYKFNKQTLVKKSKLSFVDGCYMDFTDENLLVIFKDKRVSLFNSDNMLLKEQGYFSNLEVFNILHPKYANETLILPDITFIDTLLYNIRSADESFSVQYKLYYNKSAFHLYYYTPGLLRLIHDGRSNLVNTDPFYYIPELSIIGFRLIYLNTIRKYCFYEINGILMFYRFGSSSSIKVFENVVNYLSFKYCEKEQRIYAIDKLSQINGGKLKIIYISNINKI